MKITQFSTGWVGEALRVLTNRPSNICAGAGYAMASTAPEENLSILLSAFHGGSPVYLLFQGCDANNIAVLKAVVINI